MASTRRALEFRIPIECRSRFTTLSFALCLERVCSVGVPRSIRHRRDQKRGESGESFALALASALLGKIGLMGGIFAQLYGGGSDTVGG